MLRHEEEIVKIQIRIPTSDTWSSQIILVGFIQMFFVTEGLKTKKPTRMK